MREGEMKLTYSGFDKDLENDLDWTLEEHGWIREASGYCLATQQRDIEYKQLYHSCKSCQHERYSEDGHDYGVVTRHWVRECKAGEQARIDAIWERLSEATPGNRHLSGVQIPPVVDCPGWVPKARGTPGEGEVR